MANPFLARGRVSRHANFKRPPLSRWGPCWPVNHNTDTLLSVLFCTCWYKSNHCTSSAEKSHTKHMYTQCRWKGTIFLLKHSAMWFSHCMPSHILHRLSIAVCAVSCFALVLSALLCTLVSHLMAVNHSWALWPVSRPQRGFNLGPAHHQLSLSSSYHFHFNNHHHHPHHHYLHIISIIDLIRCLYQTRTWRAHSIHF